MVGTRRSDLFKDRFFSESEIDAALAVERGISARISPEHAREIAQLGVLNDIGATLPNLSRYVVKSVVNTVRTGMPNRVLAIDMVGLRRDDQRLTDVVMYVDDRLRYRMSPEQHAALGAPAMELSQRSGLSSPTFNEATSHDLAVLEFNGFDVPVPQPMASVSELSTHRQLLATEEVGQLLVAAVA